MIDAPKAVTHFLSAWLFPRLLGFIYLCAFLSLNAQLLGLLGENGITPAAQYLRVLYKHFGSSAYWHFPSIFWLAQTDFALRAACLSGCVLSAFLICGVLPRLCALLLWALYLSFLNADYVFLQFQWDNLLVEAGFLAIFLCPFSFRFTLASASPPRETGVLFRWLLYRLIFCSGVVKLASGDMTWRSLTALDFHYLTQPLPNLVAYYAAKIPEMYQHASTAAMFVIELGVPFLYFCRPALQRLGAACTVFFQLLIMLTGNYAYFNLLTISLCVFLLDDDFLKRLLPPRLRAVFQAREPALNEPKRPSWPLAFLLYLIIGVGVMEIAGSFGLAEVIPPGLRSITAVTSPLRIVNSYGLFAVMTTERREIVVEGSDDGKSWRGYHFRYKPDDLKEPPHQVAPHQPRLDWQLWFAALGSAENNPWFIQFLARLHEGKPEVLALLRDNPFPDSPPRYLRALLYQYEFSKLSEKQADGVWWKRKLIGAYIPVIEFQEKNSGQ